MSTWVSWELLSLSRVAGHAITSLNLYDCALDAAGMNLILELANWPLLASLDISYTDLMRDPGYISMLPAFKGRWPLLQRLREWNDMNYVG